MRQQVIMYAQARPRPTHAALYVHVLTPRQVYCVELNVRQVVQHVAVEAQRGGLVAGDLREGGMNSRTVRPGFVIVRWAQKRKEQP